jgi:hypothetical protein
MSNHNKCPHCYRHYVEGTAAWALYMMRMGCKVTNPKYDPRVYHLPEGSMIHVNGIKSIATNQWIDYWCIDIPDGWQIYEEPQPAYKVGDWAKYDIDSYLRVIETPGRERTLCKTLSGVIVYPYTSCLTKVSPSEVVIHIGCLSGTVEKVQDYAYFLLWHSKTDCDYSMIKWSAIDAPTRELVKALLKAQRECWNRKNPLKAQEEK